MHFLYKVGILTLIFIGLRFFSKLFIITYDFDWTSKYFPSISIFVGFVYINNLEFSFFRQLSLRHQ